jgi:hypothetical protein
LSDQNAIPQPRQARFPLRWFIGCALVLVALDVWVIWKDAMFSAAVRERLALVSNATGMLPILEMQKQDPPLGIARQRAQATGSAQRSQRARAVTCW